MIVELALTMESCRSGRPAVPTASGEVKQLHFEAFAMNLQGRLSEHHLDMVCPTVVGQGDERLCRE